MVYPESELKDGRLEQMIIEDIKKTLHKVYVDLKYVIDDVDRYNTAYQFQVLIGIL